MYNVKKNSKDMVQSSVGKRETLCNLMNKYSTFNLIHQNILIINLWFTAN